MVAGGELEQRVRIERVLLGATLAAQVGDREDRARAVRLDRHRDRVGAARVEDMRQR